MRLDIVDHSGALPRSAPSMKPSTFYASATYNTLPKRLDRLFKSDAQLDAESACLVRLFVRLGCPTSVTIQVSGNCRGVPILTTPPSQECARRRKCGGHTIQSLCCALSAHGERRGGPVPLWANRSAPSAAARSDSSRFVVLPTVGTWPPLVSILPPRSCVSINATPRFSPGSWAI